MFEGIDITSSKFKLRLDELEKNQAHLSPADKIRTLRGMVDYVISEYEKQKRLVKDADTNYAKLHNCYINIQIKSNDTETRYRVVKDELEKIRAEIRHSYAASQQRSSKRLRLENSLSHSLSRRQSQARLQPILSQTSEQNSMGSDIVEFGVKRGLDPPPPATAARQQPSATSSSPLKIACRSREETKRAAPPPLPNPPSTARPRIQSVFEVGAGVEGAGGAGVGVGVGGGGGGYDTPHPEESTSESNGTTGSVFHVFSVPEPQEERGAGGAGVGGGGGGGGGGGPVFGR